MAERDGIKECSNHRPSTIPLTPMRLEALPPEQWFLPGRKSKRLRKHLWVPR